MISKLDQSSDYYKFLQNDFDSETLCRFTKDIFQATKETLMQKSKAGVDEILKDKKKLLSFESPHVSFFSIWALQKVRTTRMYLPFANYPRNEISKLQQIGEVYALRKSKLTA